MSKWFLNWYRKQLLLSVLKNRSKNNDVGLYFSDRGFIIVKMEKKSNICFAADLPEFDQECILRMVNLLYIVAKYKQE